MQTNEIKIVELPAFRAVRFHGFGKGPEDIAFNNLFSWLAKKNYNLKSDYRCFGFNNPDPTPGSENYGYEVWLSIPGEESVDDAEIITFPGGKYATTRCSGSTTDAGAFIPQAWQNLTGWLENSPYQLGHHQWLEEQICSPGKNLIEMFDCGTLTLDLYMPIR